MTARLCRLLGHRWRYTYRAITVVRLCLRCGAVEDR